MGSGWDLVTNQPATKKQRQALYRFLSVFNKNHDLVKNISHDEASQMLDLFARAAAAATPANGVEGKVEEKP